MRHEPRKIALFVDFDNIYLGLRETSREAAEAFATRPHSWLQWIEHGMPLGDVEHAAPRENRVLIRQCYLNPDTFGKYRGYFTRAGFSVVDCPPLTSRGKNSGDIVMVMDILDALRHETRFDRFVIMSADADFTPVLQRLRAHDRRTAVMVSGLAAPAYRASCDKLITEDIFIEHALEMGAAPDAARAYVPSLAPPAAAAIRDPELLAAIARRVYDEASAADTLPASELPRILREFKEFTPTSNWLGYYSLQGLTEALLAYQPELRITDDDPWRVAVRVAGEPAVPAAAPGSAAAAGDAARREGLRDGEGTPRPEWEALRERVVALVGRMVAEAPDALVMGRAAHAAIQEVGGVLTETRWLGRGTFKNLLLSAPSLPFQVVSSPLPGFLYDPARHAAPGDRASVDGLAELGQEMASLIRRIHQLTDAPKLPPRQYRVLFEVIAKELGRAPYTLMGTGKAVRDQCVERGEPISRQAITWILRGLGYGGYRFFDAPHRAGALAEAYRGNLLNVLRQAQVALSDDELRMVDDWLLAPGDDAADESGAGGSADAAESADAGDSADASADAGHAEPSAEAVTDAADARLSTDAEDSGGPRTAGEPDYDGWIEALLEAAARSNLPALPQAEDVSAGDEGGDGDGSTEITLASDGAPSPPTPLPRSAGERGEFDPASADSDDAVPAVEAPAEDAAEADTVAAQWEMADDAAGEEGGDGDGSMEITLASDGAPSPPAPLPRSAGERGEIDPASAESADDAEQPSAADQEAAGAEHVSAADRGQEIGAGEEIVTAQWEAVDADTPATQLDVPRDPAAQIDAFSASPTRADHQEGLSPDAPSVSSQQSALGSSEESTDGSAAEATWEAVEEQPSASFDASAESGAEPSGSSEEAAGGSGDADRDEGEPHPPKP